MFTSSARSLFRSLPVFAMAAMLVSGCSDLTEPGARLEARRDGVKLVPIKAEALIGYSYSIVPAVGCDPSSSLNRRTGFDLTGDVSHLGSTSIAAEHCNSRFGPAVGGGTMTAANGDQVWFSHTISASGISVVPGGHRFEVPFVVAGGTGRFTDASGSGTFICFRSTVADLPAHDPPYNFYYECSMSGMISTVGSAL